VVLVNGVKINAVWPVVRLTDLELAGAAMLAAVAVAGVLLAAAAVGQMAHVAVKVASRYKLETTVLLI
jgi:hypothetical protein